MFKKYPSNFYLRIPLQDFKNYLTPEFQAHLRVVFQVNSLDSVILEQASNDEIIFHFKGEK